MTGESLRMTRLAMSCVFAGLVVVTSAIGGQEVRRQDPAWVVADRDKRVVYSVPGASDVAVTRDVVYRTVDGVSLAMDVYSPPRLEPGERRPLVVLIHGGWLPPNLLTQPKDWGQFRSLGALMAASGFVTVAFNHRFFSSMNSLPDAESDLLAAIAYLRAHAESLHTDADRVTLWAFSGSGVLLTHALRDRPAHVRAVVSYYAALDLQGIADARPGTIRPEIVERYSPLRVVAGSGPRPSAGILLVRSGLDRREINDPADRFAAAALAKNADIEVISHMDGHHGFDIEDDTERSRAILRRTVEFIRERSGR